VVKKIFELQSEQITLPLSFNETANSVVSIKSFSARRIKGRCEIVVPEIADAPAKKWLSMLNSSEFTLLPFGTANISIQIQIPTGAVPKRYAFQLLCYDVNDPEETSICSELIQFAVAEPAKPAETVTIPPKKFAWWQVYVPILLTMIVLLVASKDFRVLFAFLTFALFAIAIVLFILFLVSLPIILLLLVINKLSVGQFLEYSWSWIRRTILRKS
jgi:hypothetical protein